MIQTVLILAGVLAQQGDGPFVFQLDDGEKTVKIVGYGDESEFDNDIFKIWEDKPWEGPPTQRTVIKRNVKSYFRPGAAELDQYYAEGWKANGGVQVETPHGKMWVFREEYDLAQRAAAMAKSRHDQTLGSPPKPDTAHGPGELAQRQFSFAQLWGAHIAVLTLGLGLSALVVWFLILE